MLNKLPSKENVLIFLSAILQAILSIQAAFRGHKARHELMQKEQYGSDATYDYNDDESSSLCEDDVILIQAAFRGHKSRKEMLQRDRNSQYRNNEEDFAVDAPKFRRYQLIGLFHFVCVTLRLFIPRLNIPSNNRHNCQYVFLTQFTANQQIRPKIEKLNLNR